MISSLGLWSLSRCLLVGLQSRGRDATGYAYINHDGNTNFAKAPIEAKDFIKVPGHLLYEPPKQMPMNLLLHARYATQGEPSENMNNHPLYSKTSGLCLVHNGWFMNDGDITREFSLKLDATVDTEAYLRLIEKFYIEGDVKSIEVAIKEATKCFYGSLACGMIQGGKPNVMWLWRDRGELAVLKTEWGYVFASTMKILVNAIGCLSAIDIASWTAFSIPPSTLVKFELGKKPRIIQLEPIEWANSAYFGDISITSYDGEEKIRRVKKVSGNTTYYYGNNNNFAAHNAAYFQGYDANKGYQVPGLPGTKSFEANNGAQTPASEKKPERPQNHHTQCQCKTCSEWYLD